MPDTLETLTAQRDRLQARRDAEMRGMFNPSEVRRLNAQIGALTMKIEAARKAAKPRV